MRIIDTERGQSVRGIDLFLTISEAKAFCQHLQRLLMDPEKSEHFHLKAEDWSREVTCSIVTPRKLAELSYTELERRVFDEK